MAPFFYFQVDQMREHARHIPRTTTDGTWLPPKQPLYNELVQSGVTGKYFYYNGQRIQEANLPPGAVHFKTVSVYQDDSRNFWITNCDATTSVVGDGYESVSQAIESDNETDEEGEREWNRDFADWRELSFSWDEHNYSSYATNAGDRQLLRTQRPNQQWPARLLPSHYHAYAASHTLHPQYGGMNGDLPIILALIAFSDPEDAVQNTLLNCVQNSRFYAGGSTAGWVARRGMVVRTWFWPPYSTKPELKRLEEGRYGNIFD